MVDATNNTDGFKQGSTAAKHYDYDAFGNLKVDRNKGITAIKYNHLNLPTEVVFANGKINYLYTATGEKVQKKVTQGSTTTVTDYVDGFQYVAGALSFFPTAEGYFNAETQNYVYQHLDHLGNVRVSYSDANKNNKIDVGEIVEENNYYPFGLAHKGYNEKNNTIAKNYKYQYNAKELQEELGFNVYDYGARNYDATIGRWMNVDPLAEKTYGWNPYHYVHNNPINLVDPTGMSGEDWVHYKGENGKNQFIFDGDVTTVEQAKAKGYNNVQSVSSNIYLNSGTDSYMLSENATVTDMNTNKTVNTGFNLADGSYIGENNMLKSSAEGLQKGGDRMFYGGITATGTGTVMGNPFIAALGAASATVGGLMSTAGSVLEIVNDAIHDKFSVEKTITKGVLFFLGNKLGKVGSSQLENMMNEGLIDALDKTLDHARDKEIGPYKKQL